jgi:hypothetical protein
MEEVFGSGNCRSEKEERKTNKAGKPKFEIRRGSKGSA